MKIMGSIIVYSGLRTSNRIAERCSGANFLSVCCCMIPAVVVALFCLLPMFDMFFYERKQEKKVLVLVLVLNAGLYSRRTPPKPGNP